MFAANAPTMGVAKVSIAMIGVYSNGGHAYCSLVRSTFRNIDMGLSIVLGVTTTCSMHTINIVS